MASPDTYVSTNQASTQTRHANTPVDSIRRTVAGTPIRIDAKDAKGQRHTHIRARQLTEFTQWLSAPTQPETPQLAGQQPQATPSHYQPAQQPSTTPNSISTVHGVNVRVDEPSSIAHPKLPASGYQAGTDEILRIIDKLKSDGRILAENQQAEEMPTAVSRDADATTASSDVLLNWPTVTSSLLGSPAILNLEMNIDGPATQRCQQLVVTSTQSGSGATTIAISLARQLAVHGHRVLLVDANIANAAMTNRLMAENRQSWVQAISSRSSLADVIYRDGPSEISLLPLQPIKAKVSWPRRIISKLNNIIASIAWNFDYIIFDAGDYSQWLSETDQPAAMSDMTLLVNSKNIAGVADQRRAECQIAATGISSLLTVQNFSQINNIAGIRASCI